MSILRGFLAWLHERDEGQGLVEYGLIIGLIAVVSVAALTSLGQTVLDTLYTPAQNMFP
jgi:Flp pilus assembly pilin Flp